MSEEHPVGYRRPGWPELMSLAEMVEVSGRSARGLRHMRQDYDDFPEPIAVLATGAVYAGEEARAFLAKYPLKGRQGPLADEVVLELIRRIQAGEGADHIAAVMGIGRATVFNYKRELKNDGNDSNA